MKYLLFNDTKIEKNMHSSNTLELKILFSKISIRQLKVSRLKFAGDS